VTNLIEKVKTTIGLSATGGAAGLLAPLIVIFSIALRFALLLQFSVSLPCIIGR